MIARRRFVVVIQSKPGDLADAKGAVTHARIGLGEPFTNLGRIRKGEVVKEKNALVARGDNVVVKDAGVDGRGILPCMDHAFEG